MISFLKKILSKLMNPDDEKDSSHWHSYIESYRQEEVEDTEKPPPLSTKKECRQCKLCGESFVSYICQNQRWCSKKCALESGVLHQTRRRKKKVLQPAEGVAIVPETPKAIIAPIVVEEVVAKPTFPTDPPSQYQTLHQKKTRIKALSEW